MKRILLLVAISVSTFGFSQVTKDVGNFEKVSVYDRISVELIPSSENKVVISGDRQDDVELVNKNGNLKVKMKLKKLLDGEEVQAQVYFTDLNSIDLSEGSFITSDEVIKVGNFDINTKEGAEVRLKLDSDKASIRAVTGAKVKVSGNARILTLTGGTGGIIDAEKLNAEDVIAKITTGGEINLRASKTVDASVRAGGSIIIFGKPSSVSQKTTLGGSIIVSER